MGRLRTDGGVADPLPLDILKSHSPDIAIACNLHSRMPTRYTSTKKKTIIKAEQMATAGEEDLASGMINRVAGLLSIQSIYDDLKPMAAGIINRIQSSRMVKETETDLGGALKEQLILGRQKLMELISKHFSSVSSEQRLSIIDIIMHATNIQQYQKNRLMLKYEPPDILIEPDVVDIAALEFTRSASIIDEGREKTLETIPEITRLLEERIKPTLR
jgi:predicted acylesterase/phospholipase RssA